MAPDGVWIMGEMGVAGPARVSSDVERAGACANMAGIAGPDTASPTAGESGAIIPCPVELGGPAGLGEPAFSETWPKLGACAGAAGGAAGGLEPIIGLTRVEGATARTGVAIEDEPGGTMWAACTGTEGDIGG